MIGELLDLEKYPLHRLVIRLNWGEDDLTAANAIFEEYDKLLENNRESSFPEFEKRLRERFDIDHHGVRNIVLAFYDIGQWIDVCKRYAAISPVSEFSRINHPQKG
jgi:hypothetical protein